jgi:hypothetical protein
MSAVVAVQQRVDGVIFEGIEMFEDFSISSGFENCGEVWVGNQNLKVEIAINANCLQPTSNSKSPSKRSKFLTCTEESRFLAEFSSDPES